MTKTKPKTAPFLTPNVAAWTAALNAVRDLERTLNRIHSDAEGYNAEAAGRGMKAPEHGDAIRWAARAEATLGELAEELRAGRAAALYGVEYAGLPDWEEPGPDPGDPKTDKRMMDDAFKKAKEGLRDQG